MNTFDTPFVLSIDRDRLVRACIGIALGLSSLHVVFQVIARTTGHNGLYGLAHLFDLDAELSIPSYFSATLLLFAGALLGVIAVFERQIRSPFARQWTALALTFCYLAVDEAASIHELLARPALWLMGQSMRDVFYYLWVIPGFAVVVAFALFFIPFLRRLDSRMRWQWVAAGAIYVGGALGFETLSGRAIALYGPNVAFQSMVVCEETSEMLGVIVFIDALLVHLGTHYRDARFRVGGVDLHS